MYLDASASCLSPVLTCRFHTRMVGTYQTAEGTAAHDPDASTATLSALGGTVMPLSAATP